MVDDARDRDAEKASMEEKHRKFHNRIAGLFFAFAVLFGAWMLFGPESGQPLVLLFVQLPLFVIFAFIGIKQMVKAAKGMPGGGRR